MERNNDSFDFVVTDEYEGIRIDKLISELIDSLSRTYIKKLIDDKKVFCNGKNVKASFSVSEGDHISMEIPPVEVPQIKCLVGFYLDGGLMGVLVFQATAQLIAKTVACGHQCYPVEVPCLLWSAL